MTAPQQLTLPVAPRQECRFDNFIAGANAALVHRIGALLHEPVGGTVRRLLCVGEVGLGKSHLLQSSVSAALADGRQAFYLPLAQLAPEALNGIEHAHLLAVDDVHAVIGDMRWERALFALYNQKRRGVFLMASAAHWQELTFVLADWQSRMQAFELFRMQSLTESELRLLFLQRARGIGLVLGDDAVEYMLARLPRSADALLGALDSLADATLEEQRRLTLPFIREVLFDKVSGTGTAS